MENRSIGKIIVLTIITCGIYSFYLFVKTKGEMNRQGANIPTTWLIIVPFVNYWWYWKYSQGVERVTNQEVSTAMSFIMLIMLSGIGQIVLQTYFNKVGAGGLTPAMAPAQPGAFVAAAAPQPAAPQTFAPAPTAVPSMPPTPTDPTTPPVAPLPPAEPAPASPFPPVDTPPTPPAPPTNPV